MKVTRTELVWPRKYADDGSKPPTPRVSLPFQIIETVNESRATREEAKKVRNLSLFDAYEGREGETFEAGWRNKLIWGDNLLVLGSLLDRFAGRIDLIYIDPPFATGADFTFTAEIGDSGEEVVKEQSAIEEKAYRDTWGRDKDSWFEMMVPRLTLMRDLLSERGTIYIHMDWYVGHHLRPVLDEIFGESNSLGEIIWAYGSPSGGRVSGAKLVKAHDVIFIYAKEYGKHRYKVHYLPYSEKYIKDWFKWSDSGGRKYRRRMRWDAKAGRNVWEKQYLDESKGVPASTVWSDIQQAYADPRAYKAGITSEITGYPTQKPEKLLDRMIDISSEPGDLIADFFCGSGTTLAAAEKSGRRWIGCDLGRWAIHVTRKRLLGLENCKPFDVMNLGKYERQYWQSAVFSGQRGRTAQEQSLYDYLAFILKLYGAQPVAGLATLHGKKGRALVHVGAVDAPVTIDEVAEAVRECVKVKQAELHVLGWEWEMGLYELMVEDARRQGVKLVLLQIPREVMEQTTDGKSDVRFFELAYLQARIAAPRKLTAQVTLADFVIPNTELIPEDVRAKIRKWSDYIDYWAVDWDFRDDTFMQGWVAYRTRKDRTLTLTSDPHEYPKAGKYRLLVKVIDIFGNDTSQVFVVEAR